MKRELIILPKLEQTRGRPPAPGRALVQFWVWGLPELRLLEECKQISLA